MLQNHVQVMLMLATYWLTILMPILPYICCHVSMQTCDRHHLYFTKATRLNTQACGGGRDVISIVNFIHESFLPSQSCLYGCMSVILHIKAANYIGALQHVNNNTAAVATAYSWCLLSIPQLWVHHQDLPQSPHPPSPHVPHMHRIAQPPLHPPPGAAATPEHTHAHVCDPRESSSTCHLIWGVNTQHTQSVRATVS